MKHQPLLYIAVVITTTLVFINPNLGIYNTILSLGSITENDSNRNNIQNKMSAHAQGFNDNEVPNNVWEYYTTTSNGNATATSSLSVYTQVLDMPTPRSEAPAAAIGAKIYVIGGSPGAMDVVEAYDANNQTWTSSSINGSSALAPLPVGVNHAAAASFDGKLYVVGGFLKGKVSSNHLFVYDPIANNWSQGAPMPTPRAALTANFINGTLYVAGGTNANINALDTMEAYHPSNNTWTKIDPMPTARQHLTSAVVDGKLYVIGGRTAGPSTNLNPMEVFDPLSGNWTVVEEMPSNRSGIAAAVIGDAIYVFGGESSDMVFDNNEKYNITSGNWTAGEKMPTARHGLAAAVVDDNIYLIGGGLEPRRSDPATSIVEVYRPATTFSVTIRQD